MSTPNNNHSHHRALVLSSDEGFHLESLPAPNQELGTAIVQILSATILSYGREIYSGERRYPLPSPLTAGYSAIGRIISTGSDATVLMKGQLVFVDCVVRAKDDPTCLFMINFHQGMSEQSARLMKDVWNESGTFAEMAKVPLENCFQLDEGRLCKELGYGFQELVYLTYLLVPYGGLRDVGVEAGEKVLVCPATGGFGGAGVLVAAAMGCKVIAMGRNEKELERLKEFVRAKLPGSPGVETVKITGDEKEETAAIQPYGPLDAVLDLTPPAASNATHLSSAVSCLRYGGRVSLMGFAPMPNAAFTIVPGHIQFKGKLMYGREDITRLVEMLKHGLFPKGKDLVDIKAFKLEEWKDAFDTASEHTGIGRLTVFEP